MSTFEGKSEKVELFQDFFKKVRKSAINSWKKTKKNYFHFLIRGDALETFTNNTSLNRESLGEILTVFRKK